MSLSKIINSPTVPRDLANELGPEGVREILEIFWLSYHDMIRAAYTIKEGQHEDEITEDWYGFIEERWFCKNRATVIKLHLYPAAQHIDKTMAKSKGQPPKIDFCFRTWRPDDRYFGVECKNLIEGDSYLNNRYMDTGVMNYVSGRYGSSSTENALIGYVLKGELPKMIKTLGEKIIGIDGTEGLFRDLSYMDPHYLSRHVRSDGKEITIDHLFFDFTD